jgi:hypothetical protein
MHIKIGNMEENEICNHIRTSTLREAIQKGTMMAHREKPFRKEP